MRQLLLTYLLTILSCALLGQSTDIWTTFWNKDSTLMGFKDKNGSVKISPRFTKGLMAASQFKNIIAVTEQANGSYKSYYLTKKGKIVGKDSLYVVDNTADCESEGFIRFRDKKTDKAGMFNSQGEIVIPARYNCLSKVRNGMVIALKGAEKKSLNLSDPSDFEEFQWVGGKYLLINTNNKVLINNFENKNYLDFFSLQKSGSPSRDTIRKNYLSADGQYYSFVDFEKEFKQWLRVHLLGRVTRDNLEKVSFGEITYWKEPNGWTVASRKDFLDRNFELIKVKLLALKSGSCDYNIFPGGVYGNANDCDDSTSQINIETTLVTIYKYNGHSLQDYFDFVRTDEGYKLTGVTIRDSELK